MNKKYYVYEWFIIGTGEIFYVGKGCDNRATSMKNRNEYFKNIRKKHECDYRIVKDNLEEEEAYALEYKYGMELKSQGLARACDVLGKTDKFISNDVKKKISKTLKGKPARRKRMQLSEEHKKKISDAHKGKKLSEEHIKKIVDDRKGYKHSDETKKKLSLQKQGANNPMYNKKQSQETINKRISKLKGHIVTEETRKKIGIANGKQVLKIDKDTDKIISMFCSASEAGRVLNLNASKICAVCNGKRKTTGGYKWRYVICQSRESRGKWIDCERLSTTVTHR